MCSLQSYIPVGTLLFLPLPTPWGEKKCLWFTQENLLPCLMICWLSWVNRYGNSKPSLVMRKWTHKAFMTHPNTGQLPVDSLTLGSNCSLKGPMDFLGSLFCTSWTWKLTSKSLLWTMSLTDPITHCSQSRNLFPVILGGGILGGRKYYLRTYKYGMIFFFFFFLDLRSKLICFVDGRLE